MCKQLISLLAGVFAFFVAVPCWSQCYVPDTEYHDRAQRRFNDVRALAHQVAVRTNP